MRFSVIDHEDKTSTIVTVCRMCKTEHALKVPTWKLMLYESGAKIQEAFPDLSPDDRERIISGTCPECWNKMFPE